MDVIIKLGELSDVSPDFFAFGVENMRAVFVDLDAGLRIGVTINVAGEMIALLDDEDAMALTREALGDSSAKKPSPGDDVWVGSMITRSARFGELFAGWCRKEPHIPWRS